MKSRFAMLAAATMFAVVAIAPAFAADSDDASARASLGSDQFIAGSSIRIDHPIEGDLIVFGGKVGVSAPVAGDLVVAGGAVRLDASVGQSLYAAGGDLRIDGAVGRSLRIAGGRITVGKSARIAGNLTLAGGQVEVAGTVGGSVQAAGGRILVDGPVSGDVIATTSHLELGPNARVGGKLRYASEGEVQVDGAAQVAGGIERMSVDGWAGRTSDSEASPEAEDGENGAVAPRHGHGRHGRFGRAWAWTVGLMVLAAVLVAALPAFYSNVGRTAQARFGACLLAGLVALVVIPIAAVILLVTIIGIPLSLLVVAAYLVLLLAGYVTTAAVAGDWALARFKPAVATAVGWRVGAAAVAMLAIGVIGRIPVLGGLVFLVALLLGIGALLLQLRRAPALS
jgi:cytoskeletal protein CcmA (bactofilin family)